MVKLNHMDTPHLITVNRTFRVTVDTSKYKLNGLWNQVKLSPKINVGETITFNQWIPLVLMTTR